MTEEYAPEEPEYDPDHEPDPDAVFYEPEDRRPEPEDRRDPPRNPEASKATGRDWLRRIREENGLPTNVKIRSGRDMR